MQILLEDTSYLQTIVFFFSDYCFLKFTICYISVYEVGVTNV